ADRLPATVADPPARRSDRAAASDWKSGDLVFDPTLGSSRSAGHDEPCYLSQKFRPLFEQIKMGNRLVGQQLGLRPRPLGAENRDEGRLAGGRVGPDRLAGFGRRAFNVK